MTQTSMPFDNTAAYEVNWQQIMRAIMPAGVIRTGRTHIDANLLEVYADSSGMQVKVKTGAGYVEGFFYNNDAEVILAIGTADPTNPRIDVIMLELDRTANEIVLAVKAGTPAGSPTAPTMTETDTLWQVALAQVAVAAAASTIAAGNVTDVRSYTSDFLYKAKATNVNNTLQTLTDAATIAWDADLGAVAHVSIGASRTMGAPTNLRAGATYMLRVNRTGAFTISTWNAVFKWPNGAAPTQSSASGEVDLFSFYCPDGTNLEGTMLKDMS